jgi:hypothetical protein
MIEHAAQIPTEDPAVSGQAWAEVDRAITDQAPFVFQVNPITVDFVSERLGNYQYNPQWGAPARPGVGALTSWLQAGPQRPLWTQRDLEPLR